MPDQLNFHATLEETFGEAVAGRELLIIFCRMCRHPIRLSAEAIPEPIPHDTPLSQIGAYWKCSECGDGEISVTKIIPHYENGMLRPKALPVIRPT